MQWACIPGNVTVFFSMQAELEKLADMVNIIDKYISRLYDGRVIVIIRAGLLDLLSIKEKSD